MKGREDHSGRADAALGATAVEKGLLQELQATVRGKAFDGDDFCAVCLKRGNKATIYQRSVNQNRAGAALAFTATFLRAR
jgi:hypothetical protein